MHLDCPAPQLLSAPPAQASRLPGFADDAWTAIGGGPGDLYFPDEFLGEWDVTSIMKRVETPLGEEFVPNIQAGVWVPLPCIAMRAKLCRKMIARPRRFVCTYAAQKCQASLCLYQLRFKHGIKIALLWQVSDTCYGSGRTLRIKCQCHRRCALFLSLHFLLGSCR